MYKFWMVLVDGTNGCSYKHRNEESAENEAERLVRLPENQGRAATILEATEYCMAEYPPIKWREVINR